MEKCCVSFEVRTELIYIIYTSFGFKGLKRKLSMCFTPNVRVGNGPKGKAPGIVNFASVLDGSEYFKHHMLRVTTFF
jgi:hypothetical protein